MKITIKHREPIPMGTERIKKRFLVFPKILRPTREPNNTLVFKWLCMATWVERMETWEACVPEMKPHGVYGWRAKFWVDT